MLNLFFLVDKIKIIKINPKVAMISLKNKLKPRRSTEETLIYLFLNIILAIIVPKNPPIICEIHKKSISIKLIDFFKKKQNDTTGLKWESDNSLKTLIKTTKIAPVAIVLASNIPPKDSEYKF